MSNPEIPLSEYATRRQKLSTAIGKAVGIVFSGSGSGHLTETWRPHPLFEYLTGITDEPGAVVVLDPGHAVASRQEMLFLESRDPEIEKWDGYRLSIGKTLRDHTGFKGVFRHSHRARFVTEAAQRTRTLACLHAFANYDQPVSPDMDLFRKLQARIPDVKITDQTDAPARLRAVKSRNEVAMIQKAVDITADGFAAVCRAMKPGLNEFDVQTTLEHAYRTGGSRGPAFGTIVGSGINSTVLHYRANEKRVEKGELVCIDSGAAFGGYGADITRTIPADGVFTDRQRKVYEVVLKALKAATAAVKPGTTIAKVDRAARTVIDKAGFGDFFIHGIGHHLGLETHDITPAGPLKVGNVITIEPGIYLPDEALGVRIEDDVVVTKDGCRVLSSKIPRSVSGIEKAMAGRS
jgi:Xaa-Pro aminopeptidase